jgi:segregation and condensation protein B
MLTPSAALEALIFASNGIVQKKTLMELLGVDVDKFTSALTALSEQLEGHGITLIQTTDEVELRTVPEAADIVQRLREGELARDLGRASLETLAVIAYQDGATRGEIDWIRGVNSTASLRSLLMRGLIEGKEDLVDKRRIRYSVTIDALAHLGLKSLQELPRYDEFASQAKLLAASTETTQS